MDGCLKTENSMQYFKERYVFNNKMCLGGNMGCEINKTKQKKKKLAY